MCGIAGFSISDSDHRRLNCRELAKCLAKAIEQRGRDATGVAWSQQDEDGVGTYYMKDAVPATEFVYSMDQIPKHTRTAIIHTRYATKGSPANNANNHPILVGSTVGIHNGTIRNDDEIIEVVGTGRTGQVDTEAIFRLIDAAPDTATAVQDLDLLEGSAAVAWYDTEEPTILNLARVKTSPLWVGSTEGGSMIFASTEYLLRSATAQAGVKLVNVKEIPEGMYLKIVNGKVVDVDLIGQPVQVA